MMMMLKRAIDNNLNRAYCAIVIGLQQVDFWRFMTSDASRSLPIWLAASCEERSEEERKWLTLKSADSLLVQLSASCLVCFSSSRLICHRACCATNIAHQSCYFHQHCQCSSADDNCSNQRQQQTVALAANVQRWANHCGRSKNQREGKEGNSIGQILTQLS